MFSPPLVNFKNEAKMKTSLRARGGPWCLGALRSYSAYRVDWLWLSHTVSYVNDYALSTVNCCLTRFMWCSTSWSFSCRRLKEISDWVWMEKSSMNIQLNVSFCVLLKKVSVIFWKCWFLAGLSGCEWLRLLRVCLLWAARVVEKWHLCSSMPPLAAVPSLSSSVD